MPVPTRTSADANASADINSLQTQITSLSASYTLSTPGTNQTLTSASLARQSMAPSVDIDVTLDNSFSAGAFIELDNTSTTKVITLKSNDGSTICKVIPLSWLIIAAKQATPTATTHWSTKQAGGGWATVTTVTTQGLGTIGTTSIKVRRVGGSLEYEGILTTGTTTASEARWGFPFSLTSTSTISTLELAGDLITDTIGATIAYYLLREPSVTYFTFGYNIGTTDAYAKANGNDLSNSSILSFRASTPISGWELNG